MTCWCPLGSMLPAKTVTIVPPKKKKFSHRKSCLINVASNRNNSNKSNTKTVARCEPREWRLFVYSVSSCISGTRTFLTQQKCLINTELANEELWEIAFKQLPSEIPWCLFLPKSHTCSLSYLHEKECPAWWEHYSRGSSMSHQSVKWELFLSFQEESEASTWPAQRIPVLNMRLQDLPVLTSYVALRSQQ